MNWQNESADIIYAITFAVNQNLIINKWYYRFKNELPKILEGENYVGIPTPNENVPGMVIKLRYNCK